MWEHGWLADFLEIFHLVRDSVRLFFLPNLILLIYWYSNVHMKTEMQIFARETVNHVASFTFYLSYSNFPNIQKDGELSALSLPRGL